MLDTQCHPEGIYALVDAIFFAMEMYQATAKILTG